MKTLLLITIVASTTISLAQKGDGINACPPEEIRNGYYVFYGKDRPESGIPENGKVEEGHFVNNRREGTWIKYHYDGITAKLKGTYENNRPHGKYEKFHPNGRLREKGSFERSHYVDSLVRYHENGNIQYKAFFNSMGKEHGRVQYFYLNGQVEYEYTSDNGLIVDTVYRYFPSGEVEEIAVAQRTHPAHGITPHNELKIVYSSEKEKQLPANPSSRPERSPAVTDDLTPSFDPEGYNTIYNTDGEVWQKGSFKKGSLWDGKVYIYDREGILLKIKVFKEGIYHSDAQE